MVSLDPPAHGRLRKPAARAFTPRRVDEMEPRIRADRGGTARRVDPRAPFDVIAALAFPAADADHVQLHGRARGGLAAAEGVVPEPREPGLGRPSREEALHHAQQMVAYRRYLRELVAAKATERADDFASALLEIHDEDPEALTHEEVASILFSLSFAGHGRPTT